MATTNLFTDPVFKDGAFTSADARVRHYAIAKTMRAMDLGVELGARTYVFWGGREGAEVDGGGKLFDALSWYRDALDYLCGYARGQGYDLRFALEPKPNEPRGHAFLPTVGSALGFIATLQHPEMVGLNPELAHETMAGLSFPHALAAALDAGKLFHVDLNDQIMGRFDQDLRFGAENLKTAFFTVLTLQEGSYCGAAALRRARAPDRGRGGRLGLRARLHAHVQDARGQGGALPRRPRRGRGARGVPRGRPGGRLAPALLRRARRRAQGAHVRPRGAPSPRTRARAPRSTHRRDPARGALTVAADLAIGIDVGTSGVGVVALDRAGRRVAEADRPVPLATPRPGWTEQDPEDWVAAAEAGLQAVVHEVGADRVAAIGLSGQMHGMVALDADDRVVRPALLWNDQRTGAAVETITRAVGRARLIERTGNPAITGFQLPKVVWLRAAEPDAFARTRRVLLPKDHVGFRFTGEAVAEPSDASGTGLYHLASGSWDMEVLAALDLDPGLWPRLVRSDEIVGGLRPEVADRTGVRAGTPVVAGAGDNAAAATGLALGRAHPDVGSVSLGTSGVLFAALEAPTPDPDGRVHLFAHADGGFHLLGVILSAAGSLRWYRDTFAPGRPYAALVAEAAGAPVGAGGVVFKPYLAGERTPHLRPDLRGSFHGLSLATGSGDVVRAVLEGVAFALREALDVMSPLARPERWLATGGGAESNAWLEILADALAAPVGRPVDEAGRPAVVGAAEGAAWLAWRALGHAPERAPRAGVWLEPDPARREATEAAYARYRRLGLEAH